MTETLKKLSQAKSFREFFTELPYELIEYMAMLPLLLFILSPVLHMLRNLIGYWIYPLTIETVNLSAGLFGCVAIFLYLSKMIILGRSVKTLVKDNSAMPFFLVFVGLMLVSTFVNGFTPYALHGNWRQESLWTYIMYFVIYFFCGSIIERPGCKLLLYRLFLSIGLLLGIMTLFDQYVTRITLDFWVYSAEDGVSAIFYQHNHYAYFLTLTLLLAGGGFVYDEDKRFKPAYLVTFVINTIALILSQTFGCFLAVLIGLLFAQIISYIMHKRLNKGMLLILGLYLGVTFVMSFWYNTVFSEFLTLFSDLFNIISDSEKAKRAGNARWDLWTHTVQYISERPLLGWGVEGTAERLDLDVGNDRPHNEYLQHMVHFGIPAGLIYIAGVLAVYLHGLKEKAHLDGATLMALIAAFGYIVSAFFGNTMFYTAPFFFMTLGMAYRCKSK